nr:TonB-dependent receptor [Flavobacteriaceae bacterium]
GAKVYENPLLTDYKSMLNGSLTKEEFDRKVLNYKSRSNRKDLESFTKHSLRQDQTLSISGGNGKNTFYTSLNYISDDNYEKENNNNSIRLYLRDDLKLFEWLKTYASITGQISNSKNNEGFSAMGAYLYQPSYKLLRDENGNPLNYNTQKSQLEIDRLIGLGLQNENYYPFENYGKEYSENKRRSLVLNVGLNFKIIEGLDFDLKYGNEFYDNKYKTFWENDSYHINNLVNDATTVEDGVHNIPMGARLQKTISDGNAYTLRGQLNFNKTFGKHSVMALAGAERRRVLFKTDRMDLWGYDELSLKYQPLNYDLLRQLQNGGTYGVYGGLGESFRVPFLQEVENRFVSFYANASYTFNKKYTLNGSIRTDQSNLFGSDPKYRYKPLWSVGAKWSAHKEDFLKNVEWLNKLAFRASYGIVGNVANSSYPVLVIEDQGVDRITGRKNAIIAGNQPPNPSIRWEKTETKNIGFDLSVLQNRLNVSVDLYHKNTTDLLGRTPIDPTLGFKTALKNYGNMVNKGVEVGINGTIIRTDDFNWDSFVSFGYNKNELKYVEDQKSNIFDMANFGGYNKESYPINSLFSFRYAGLDDKGQAMYFNSKDEKVYEIDSFEDLVYSGAKTPPYTASWSNSITYKGFTLSGMLSFYGGHTMRLPKSRILGIYDVHKMNSNLDKDILNRWKEGNKGENATPTFTSNHRGIERVNKFWAFADKNTAKADFLKLRTLSLTYNLPKKFLSNIKLESFAITLQGTNLFSWYANKEGVDPEYVGFNGSYATRTLHLGEKTWSLGFNINF